MNESSRKPRGNDPRCVDAEDKAGGAYADIPFRGIVEQALAGIYVIQDERFQYVNRTFAAILGYTPEEMIGQRLVDSVPPEHAAEVVNNYHRRIDREVDSIRFLAHGRHRDGRSVAIDVHGTRLDYCGRPAVVGVGIDASERERSERDLLASRGQLRELAAHLNTMREAQRTHIARELHDVLGGTLTAMRMDIRRLQKRIGDERGDGAAGIAEALLQQAQDAIDTVRKLSEELRPGVLDHLGLPAAIAGQLQQFEQRSGIRCVLSPACDEWQNVPLTLRRATSVYRIFQEALTNVARHAGASRVFVTLVCANDRFEMCIADDGCGIAADAAISHSLGLLGMNERALELGGTLAIRPADNGGTRLELSIPISGERE